MHTILLVEDNPEILDANRSHFEENGFMVHTAANGEDALALLLGNEYDCIVLDVMLPGMDGYTLFEKARAVSRAPVIFLTCLDELGDRLKGLESGADDYLTKPYSLRELLARVNNLLRRASSAAPAPISTGGISLDAQNHMLRTPQQSITLSSTEFELFALFFYNPGVLFTRETLLAHAWPDGADPGIVAVYISKLRRKLSLAGGHIGTLESQYREGYRYLPRGDANG